jgi:methyl-accepting chemotaxis protein
LSLHNASDRIGELSNSFLSADFHEKITKISLSVLDIFSTIKSLESGILEMNQLVKSSPQLPVDFNVKLNEIASSVNSFSGSINEISMLLSARLVRDNSFPDIVVSQDKNI